MDFTKVYVGEVYGFYNGDVFCASYHEDDLSPEWEQLAHILIKANNMVGFDHISWQGGKDVVVYGLDRNQVIDLDCKLINFQFGDKIPLERQLQLVFKE